MNIGREQHQPMGAPILSRQLRVDDHVDERLQRKHADIRHRDDSRVHIECRVLLPDVRWMSRTQYGIADRHGLLARGELTQPFGLADIPLGERSHEVFGMPYPLVGILSPVLDPFREVDLHFPIRRSIHDFDVHHEPVSVPPNHRQNALYLPEGQSLHVRPRHEFGYYVPRVENDFSHGLKGAFCQYTTTCFLSKRITINP